MARKYVIAEPWRRSRKLYARTADTWTTRAYERRPRVFVNLKGLNTTVDDLHRKEGQSPYLRNIRLFGENETTQRTSVISRKGWQSLCDSDLVTKHDINFLDGTGFINFYEGYAIQYQLTVPSTLVGIGLYLQNIEKAKGYVRVSVRDNKTGAVLTSGIIPCETIDTLQFSKHFVTFIDGTDSTKVTIRIEVVDDIEPDDCQLTDPVRGRNMRIMSVGSANHEFSQYVNPNTDQCLKEEARVFQPGIGVPLTGTLETDARLLPRGFMACSKGVCYYIYVVKNAGVITLYRTDCDTGTCTPIVAPVNPLATQVRFAQAEGYVYYVDGYSVLQRIDVATWVTTPAVPTVAEITIPAVTPADLTAKTGASLIIEMNNRLFLSGFTADPNYIEFSLIDGVKPRFDQFNDFFYVPNQAPEATTCEPMTAFARIQDYLVCFTTEEKYLFYAPAGFEAGNSQLTRPEGYNLGVLNQEAVCEARNNVYFYNPTEGIIRFAGTTDAAISFPVDTELKKINNNAGVFMLYHDRKVKCYFSQTASHNDMCLMYMTDAAEWIEDDQSPVVAAISMQTDDKIIASHSNGPFVMVADQQFTDFDSEIPAEYHTSYTPSQDLSDLINVHRIYTFVMANSSNSIYLGVDFDYQDNPAVFRKFIPANVDGPTNADAIFPQVADAGYKKLTTFLNATGNAYQLRYKMYCYRSQMELMGAWTHERGQMSI